MYRLLCLVGLLICLTVSASAQLPFLPIQTRAAATPSGITLVAHAIAADDASPIVTSAIDTSGCTPGCLGVVNITGFTLGSPATITDSKGNTYTAGFSTGAGVCNSQLWYVYAPTVGSGHTVSFAGGSFGTISVAFFKNTTGSAADTVHDENGNASSAATIQPGSITPSANNSLVVTGVCFSDDSGGSTYTINGGFSISDFSPWVTGINEGGGLAYLVQTTAAAANPTWTDSSAATSQATTIAAFQ